VRAIIPKEEIMAVRVKTFGMEIRPMKAMQELQSMDDRVNEFLEKSGISRVISVSDAPTTDDKGETIGLVRVVTYET